MMDNKPIAVFIPAPLRYDEWKRRFALHWVDGEPIGITHLYSEDLVRQLQAENEALKAIINEAFKSIPAMGEDGEFYHEHHGMDGEYLGYENIPANYVVQVIEAILRKASEK
jgi:hypothetical protein